MNDEPRNPKPDQLSDDDWRSELAIALEASSPWRLRHLLYLIVGVALILWLIITFQGIIIPLIILMGIATAVGLAVILARGRSSQQDSLIWMLSIAADHQMPLATTIAAFADQYAGRYRRRILRMAALLDSGQSLPEALESTPRVASRDTVLLAHAGQESGRLAEALRTAVAICAARRPIWTAISSRIAYVLGVLMVIQAVVGFVMYFVLPRFEAIFKDFGVPLPPVTIFVIEASHFMVKYLFWIPPLNVLLLLFLPFAFLGWSKFEIPFFDRVLKRRHTALILRALAVTVDGGRTIEGGLNTLAKHYPTRWVRRKLIKAARETHEGVDWREALLVRGLIRRTDFDVLSSASAVGNLSWAMNELAESAERRLGVHILALVQTLFPLVVIAIGALVLTVAVGFFAPLVELIGRLSG
jgi:type II secretory pathway component PulF